MQLSQIIAATSLRVRRPVAPGDGQEEAREMMGAENRSIFSEGSCWNGLTPAKAGEIFDLMA